MPIAYVGLGSNIEPVTNLRAAAGRLKELCGAIAFSSVYRTAPLHEENQPPFLNAVARAETDDPPEMFLVKLRAIETELGKRPPFRFGPRTIDLDLLLYDDCVLPNLKLWKRKRKGVAEDLEARLRLPHPRMHERRFVLEPLCEVLAGARRHPVLGVTWGELLEKTARQQCDRADISL